MLDDKIQSSADTLMANIRSQGIKVNRICCLNLSPEQIEVCQLVSKQLTADIQTVTGIGLIDGINLINNYRFETLICVKKDIRIANDLLWGCKSIKQYICIDSVDATKETEKNSILMNKKFWDYMSVNANTPAEAGAWINSFTGEVFTDAELHEFTQNTKVKLMPHLTKSKRVLEVGCASGLTMYSIANSVKEYVALDLSSVTIAKNELKNANDKIYNIKMHNLYAHELDRLQEENFDVGIMNSVIQCFDGHFYLKRVIKLFIDKLSVDGVLFVGDVIDADKRIEYHNSIHEYNRKQGKTPKVDLSHDLFLPKEFFYNLKQDFWEIDEVEISSKHHTIENELTKFRYDVLIKLNKNNTNIYTKTQRKMIFSCHIGG